MYDACPYVMRSVLQQEDNHWAADKRIAILIAQDVHLGERLGGQGR